MVYYKDHLYNFLVLLVTDLIHIIPGEVMMKRKMMCFEYFSIFLFLSCPQKSSTQKASLENSELFSLNTSSQR